MAIIPTTSPVAAPAAPARTLFPNVRITQDPDEGVFRVLRSSNLVKIHDLNAAAVPTITLATKIFSRSDCLIFTSWLITNLTTIRVKEKNIKQQKIMYIILRSSKPTLALFFRSIYLIFNCIADKFTTYSTNNIT